MRSFVELTAVDGAKIPAYVARGRSAWRHRGVAGDLWREFPYPLRGRPLCGPGLCGGGPCHVPACATRCGAGLYRGRHEAGLCPQDGRGGCPSPACCAMWRQPWPMRPSWHPVARWAWWAFAGAAMTWRAACNLDSVSAAVCYYGGGMTSELEASRQALCPCWRTSVPGSLHLAGVRGGFQAGPAQGGSPYLRSRPWLQLRSAWLVQRSRRSAGWRAHFGFLQTAHRLIGDVKTIAVSALCISAGSFLL